ncbi:hypothetical protein G6F32_016111 [Rhizopus arrhizus]|nr:hypothetical protein G6F32_016111 [Rhizopus arrhizus]
MPTSFNIGSFSNANRNFTDLDTLKRVEIVRGPASSLYGSDALGGVVAFVTKDPADYLKDGKDSYVGLKFGYDGEWKGLLGGVTTAFASTTPVPRPTRRTAMAAAAWPSWSTRRARTSVSA